ncbi:hypothetical protein ABTX35_18925 [Streptomyces sp. NPDC096080]|uniref:hypothetical protein n=1 Tax=Streptomyces sp. NPDC096080 TaxID=3156693 RepID=UPI003317FDC3
MNSRRLPHDRYITAVVDALAAAGLGPTSAETSDSGTNRYETGPDAGCITQLQALLTWDVDAPGLNASKHRTGFVLLWEHPVEQWQWAPCKKPEARKRQPEPLPLHRWADPAAVVDVVRVLLAGLPVPAGGDPRLWLHFVAASEAVTAWASTKNSPQEGTPVTTPIGEALRQAADRATACWTPEPSGPGLCSLLGEVAREGRLDEVDLWDAVVTHLGEELTVPWERAPGRTRTDVAAMLRAVAAGVE